MAEVEKQVTDHEHLYPLAVEVRKTINQLEGLHRKLLDAVCEPRPCQADVEARLSRLEDVVRRYIGENVL